MRTACVTVFCAALAAQAMALPTTSTTSANADDSILPATGAPVVRRDPFGIVEGALLGAGGYEVGKHILHHEEHKHQEELAQQGQQGQPANQVQQFQQDSTGPNAAQPGAPASLPPTPSAGDAPEATNQ